MGKAISISEASAQALLSAMRANMVFAHKSIKSSLMYAVQKVLYHLKAHTKKAKPHASTKQLEKVKGEQVLKLFPTLLERNVNKTRDYWIAHSDKAKDNGALIPRWYLSCRKHSKANAAKQLKRRHAGLAKLAWFAGMRKAKINAASESIDSASTMSVATRNIEVKISQNESRYEAHITNALNYATEALTSPGAVNTAVAVAAAQMKQILNHKLKEKLEKGK